MVHMFDSSAGLHTHYDFPSMTILLENKMNSPIKNIDSFSMQFCCWQLYFSLLPLRQYLAVCIYLRGIFWQDAFGKIRFWSIIIWNKTKLTPTFPNIPWPGCLSYCKSVVFAGSPATPLSESQFSFSSPFPILWCARIHFFSFSVFSIGLLGKGYFYVLPRTLGSQAVVLPVLFVWCQNRPKKPE